MCSSYPFTLAKLPGAPPAVFARAVLPAGNASLDGDDVVYHYHRHVEIGIAVARSAGSSCGTRRRSMLGQREPAVEMLEWLIIERGVALLGEVLRAALPR